MMIRLSATECRYALLLLDEAIEAAGPEEAQFPGRERLNRGLSSKGLHKAGEPDPWKRAISLLKSAGLITTTPSSGTFVSREYGSIGPLRSAVYSALQALPPEEVAAAEAQGFPSKPWRPSAVAPVRRAKGGSVGGSAAGSGSGSGSGAAAHRKARAGRVAPTAPTAFDAHPHLLPVAESPPAEAEAEADAAAAAPLPTAPGGVHISRPRVNASLHAICTALAAAASPETLAAAAAAPGGWPAQAGTLDLPTLLHDALAAAPAAPIEGPPLDEETLRAVLQAVQNRRLGDLVVRRAVDGGGVARYSLHDCSVQHAAAAAAAAAASKSADEAEAADALIAVAHTGSEDGGEDVRGGTARAAKRPLSRLAPAPPAKAARRGAAGAVAPPMPLQMQQHLFTMLEELRDSVLHSNRELSQQLTALRAEMRQTSDALFSAVGRVGGDAAGALAGLLAAGSPPPREGAPAEAAPETPGEGFAARLAQAQAAAQAQAQAVVAVAGSSEGGGGARSGALIAPAAKPGGAEWETAAHG